MKSFHGRKITVGAPCPECLLGQMLRLLSFSLQTCSNVLINGPYLIRSLSGVPRREQGSILAEALLVFSFDGTDLSYSKMRTSRDGNSFGFDLSDSGVRLNSPGRQVLSRESKTGNCTLRVLSSDCCGSPLILASSSCICCSGCEMRVSVKVVCRIARFDRRLRSPRVISSSKSCNPPPSGWEIRV